MGIITGESGKKRKKNKKVATQSRPVCWLAVGTLAAYAVAGGKTALLARAQTTGANASNHSSSQIEMPVDRFGIPAGPLDTTLHLFSEKTGFKVVVNLPDGTSAGFQSRGVAGLYTVEQAMRQLLAGTGLSFRLSGAQEITVEIRVSETVEVNGSAMSLGLSKYTEPLLNTPQTINVVSP